MKTAALIVFLSAISVTSCILPSKDNPATCRTNDECASKVCNLATYYCVPVGDVDSGQPQGGTLGTGGTGGAGVDASGGAQSEAGTIIDAPSMNASDAVEIVDGSGGVQSEAGMIPDAPMDQRVLDASFDTRVPDAAGTCGVNGDCTDPTKAFCVTSVCVGCQSAGASACVAPTPACDLASGMCVGCTADKECTTDPSKGFCVAHTCTGCSTAGATGCSARTDGKTTCATAGTSAGQCVECLADNQCTKDVAKGFCVANACTGCNTSGATGCSARTDGKTTCATTGTSAGRCVECAADNQCMKDATKSFCVSNACAGCQLAASSACSARLATKPVCLASGAGAGTCVECSGDADCTKDATKSFCVSNACTGCQSAGANACSTRSTTKPVCLASGTGAGTCAECSTSADCQVTTKPICNSNACGACTADSQCVAKSGSNPGVCMTHQDGRCATDPETIYVANTAGCVASGSTGGTSSSPLCGLQAAVTAMSSDTTKRLIVLRSSTDPVAVTNATQVSVVGQSSGTSVGITSTGSSPGITLSGSGNLYVRDLSVVGSSLSNMGISAGTGTTLRLERVKVLNNGGSTGGGGILLNGAAFEFNDVLVSGNGTGQDGGLSWSGIYIKSLPSTGATKLNLVSIVNTGSPGMTCLSTAPGPNTGVYATGNGGGTGVNIANSCNITACTSATVGTCGSSLTP